MKLTLAQLTFIASIVALSITVTAFAQNNPATPAQPTGNPTATAAQTPTNPVTFNGYDNARHGVIGPTSDGSMKFDSPQYGFSLTYPVELSVSETDYSGVHTIYFDSTTTGDQFQIVAFPYAQVDIAAGAFKPHDAYGTNDQGLNLQDVDFIDGDTPVFKFEKNGVMYQVVGMNGQQAWLFNILQSWEFTQ